MIKKYISKGEVADQDSTHILLFSGELLEKADVTLYNPYKYSRFAGISLQRTASFNRAPVHMNGCPAAPIPPRPYY